ncbi:MAG: hypothetical protein PHR28_01025 [candidate division Zixibacteria bacterium]|nr:hypothetical protein [candidate division Zixibacteria bacterium]
MSPTAGITVSWYITSSMRKAGRSVCLRRGGFILAATAFFIAGMSPPACGGQIRQILHRASDTSTHIWNIARHPLAAGSDSVFCDGRLLQRDTDYQFNLLTGELILAPEVSCDSVVFSAFQLPDWFLSSSGNPVPQGKRLLRLDSIMVEPIRPTETRPQKLTLSGNKSFSLSVGRSGEGTFSQGLDVDFDALMGAGLHLRGSISDRGGAQKSDFQGGTTLLSELDKYFFEIEGSRVIVRGGDIYTPKDGQLPVKRIKGMSTVYRTGNQLLAADIGRPPGRFISRKIQGADGRQGPYQIYNDEGLPTGIVPGTEKVYLDGRLLESGADKEYLFEYPSGRITFSPRALITARSRIEIDCEAASTSYDQAVYDVMGSAGILGRRVMFGVGARRETDEKDRLRFGSLSAQETEILRNAGDTASQAYRSGAVATAGGSYTLASDSAGNQYYQFVGSGAGEFNVSFSSVGGGKGDYRYLGDGVYQFAGVGGGNYLPIIYLPLPGRNDFVYGTLSSAFVSGGEARLSYEGNVFDRNLFSSLDDDDNFTSRLIGGMTYKTSWMNSVGNINYRQKGYNAPTRLDPADYTRLWALPVASLSGDEIRAEETIDFAVPSARLTAGWGYLSYKDLLHSQRFAVSGHLFDSLPVSPRFEYRSAMSNGAIALPGSGLYERQNAGVSIKAPQSVRFDLDYERELTKNLYGLLPDVEKYSEYRGAAFFRRSTLVASRRIDFAGTTVGFKGPQSDKIALTVDEMIGRLTISFAGTYLNLRRLDSDRENRNERLFYASLHYAPSGGWVTIQADYRQNRQDARSSGYRYIQVQSGEGEYRLEDGRYLPDPEGDYVRVREETGSETSVSAGQKSHNVILYPGRLKGTGKLRPILSQTAFRLRTEVIEELPGRDQRRLSWIIPWVSRSGIGYTTRLRREAYSAMILPTLNFYIVNLTYTANQEEQSFGAPYSRDRKEYDIEIKNQASPTVRTTLEWRHKRNGEHGYGLTELQLVSNEYTAALIVTQAAVQLSPGVSYLNLTDHFSGGSGYGIVFSQDVTVRRPGRGEIRAELELRSLTEKREFSQPEFLVTDGRRFGRSARINLVSDYKLGKTWRLTVNLTDQFFEGRPTEFTGRGELVAQF